MSKPWNFLVYIAADNPLYDYAQISLRQITDASRFTNIKILVQFDGPSAEFATRYQCKYGTKTTAWEAPDGYTADRGERLTDFLNFAIGHGFAGQQKPEDERIFLVLWGHGAGLDHVYLYRDPQDTQAHTHSPETARSQTHEPTEADRTASGRAMAIAPPPGANAFDLLNADNTHANRYLSDLRLASILAAFESKLGHKIDLLGFDACLMGLAEICHELSSSVSLLVASDEELPKGSWPYDSILGDLTHFPGMDSGTLSAVIVSRFIERYTWEQHKTRISLSTFNLAACNKFATVMVDFVKALTSVIGDGVANRTILHARDFSRTPDTPDYIDLGVFCKEIKSSFKEGSSLHYWANHVLELLMEFPYILYHRDAGENGAIDPLGLAIYFPQVLPPTRADLQNTSHPQNSPQVHRALSQAGEHQVPVGLHLYRPSEGAEPMSIGWGKTVGGEKTVTREKSVAREKSNVRIKRELASGRMLQRELIGSEILWDVYLRLKFNQSTGWGALVEKLLVAKPGTAANSFQ